MTHIHPPPSGNTVSLFFYLLSVSRREGPIPAGGGEGENPKKTTEKTLDLFLNIPFTCWAILYLRMIRKLILEKAYLLLKTGILVSEKA
jgi:hypothetical protein